jgi:hypothetical protein
MSVPLSLVPAPTGQVDPFDPMASASCFQAGEIAKAGSSLYSLLRNHPREG